LFVLVHVAKGASIPGAADGDLHKQAIRLRRGSVHDAFIDHAIKSLPYELKTSGLIIMKKTGYGNTNTAGELFKISIGLPHWTPRGAQAWENCILFVI
jgi:hypothetical protein